MYYFPTRKEMLAAITKPGSRIVEVGVYKGEFATFLASLNPSSLLLIDPFAGRLQSGDADGNNVTAIEGEDAFKLVSDTFKGVPFVEVRRAYSTDVLKDLPDNSIDVLYVDGDHSFEGCFKDLELAYKKVKPGGFIAGHDYGCNFLKCKTAWCFGVVQAVDTFCIKYDQKILALGLDGCISFAIPLKKSA